VAAYLAAAAETPSPALLVVNKAGSLAIVDPDTPAGDMPHEAVASADGKLDFVSNYGRGCNSISVIDLVAQKELHRVNLGVLRSRLGLAFAAVNFNSPPS
jgi:DNA-binding beta-propeller fold protein YncE